MPSLLAPSTPDEMIDASRPLVELIFDKDAVAEYTLSVCDNWPSIMEVPKIDVMDYGKKCSNKLRTPVACTSGLLQKLLL
jgi:hypothetical protein